MSSDLNSVFHVALQQINKKQNDLSKQLITHSRYPTMNRREKREIESYVDQLDQLKIQKNDLEQASVLAQRIGQVLEKVRKDLTGMLAFANDYEFFVGCSDCESENGCDASGACASGQDLNVDLTRILDWEKQLKSLSQNLVLYVESQYIGNFSICHKNTTNLGNCIYYKSCFRYMQQSNRTCVPCETVSVSSCSEPGDYVVTNPNLKVKELYTFIVQKETDLENGTFDPSDELDEEEGSCHNSSLFSKDPTEIIHAITSKMDEVMGWQENNDKECVTLEYVTEVCEQNITFYTNMVHKLTHVDENELKMKLHVGDKMISELKDFDKMTFNSSNYYDVRDVLNHMS